MTTPTPDDEGAFLSAPSLVRPFLTRSLSGPVTEALSSDEGADAPEIRAYVMTRGRTTAAGDLGFESMLSLREEARALLSRLRFEHLAIAELCETMPLSVAELSAKLRVPIGAVRVIAADLVEAQVLEAHHTEKNMSNDVAMLKRLIHGVRAL